MSNYAAEEPPANEETFQSLPDDLAVSCLALVSRSDHAALFLVSKRIGTLVASPELYKARSLLGRTEEFLYVCLSTKPKSTPSWFILRPPNFLLFRGVGLGIYVIGGFKNTDVRTPDVLLLDCRNNTWRELPPMAVGRAAAAAGVVGGKIYVFGGCEEVDSSNWAEVFDPKTNTWETLAPMQDRNEGDNVIRDTLVMDEKLHAVEFWSGGCSLQYSPREGWNVFWRESEELEWKKVKGLEALQRVFSGSSRFRKRLSVRGLSSFGANIVVFWVSRRGDVWCAEISLKRREEEGEIWGAIEWSDAIIAFNHNIFTLVPVEVLYSATINL
ncbi:hypothetical protein HID58_039994 [Brassica napus]|uniref:FKB95-like N-terminal Kelch domain-containing protein n=1 Tax=Brassica napus TaxID=3708 RepID=A0ABQ8B6S4_BRANA|nr:hypothetical protein HID58_039994 [Brassica napus]